VLYKQDRVHMLAELSPEAPGLTAGSVPGLPPGGHARGKGGGANSAAEAATRAAASLVPRSGRRLARN
jgi:hypothetical protein